MSLITDFYTALSADVESALLYGGMDPVVRDSSLVSKIRLDLNYVLERVRNEGDAFVCTVLPNLGKAAELSAITGSTLEVPKGFNLFGKTRLPVFLHSLFKLGWEDDGTPVFTLEKGEWRTRNLAVCLQLIRQVTLAFSKVEDFDCMQTPEDASSGFHQRISKVPDIHAKSWVLREARRLIREVLMDGESLHPMLAQWETIPIGRHGPGAVAGGEKGASKWDFCEVAGTAQDLYFWSDDEQYLYPLGDERPRTARLCIVPKDYKSLRCICIEPKELQFAQQGLKDVLVEIISSHPLTNRSIDFFDQTKNQELCKNLALATLDLKDASDGVSLRLARILFPKELFVLLTRYRSSNVELLDGQVVKTNCLATMGSALCFPLETLIFWAIVQAITSKKSKQRVQTVRVFGDDIVLPLDVAEEVVTQLEFCGFTVNRSKSCIGKTLVRESCGTWAVGGKNCNVVKFHSRSCTSLKAWLALVEQAKRLTTIWSSSLAHATVTTILASCDAFLGMRVDNDPKGKVHSMRYVFGSKGQFHLDLYSRYNTQLCRSEVRVPILSRGLGASTLPGYKGLYAWLTGTDTRPWPLGTDKVKMAWVDTTAFLDGFAA